MKNIHKRYLLFLLGCIPLRSYFAYHVKNSNKEHLKQIYLIGIILAIAWMVIYLTNTRTTGPEVFGDKIWWNNLRPVHSILYGSFSYMAYNQHKYSYIPIAIDTILGLCSFLYYHSS